MPKPGEPQFAEDAGGISYVAPVPIWLRLLAGFFAIAMLLIPYPFLIYTRWLEPDWTILLSLFAVVFPTFVAGVFGMLALAPARKLRFDAGRRVIIEYLSGPLGRWRREHDFRSVTDASIEMRHPDDDGPYPVLKLHLTGRRPMEIGAFEARPDAEFWRARILALVGTR